MSVQITPSMDHTFAGKRTETRGPKRVVAGQFVCCIASVLIVSAALCAVIVTTGFVSRGAVGHRRSSASAGQHKDSLAVGFVGPDERYGRAVEIRPHGPETVARRLVKCGAECICSKGGIMKYGRWCGYGYAACDGLGSCDELDECCRLHDMCVSAHGYTDCSCTSALAKCARCAYLHAVGSGPGTGFCDLAAEAALGVLVELESLLPHCFVVLDLPAATA